MARQSNTACGGKGKGPGPKLPRNLYLRKGGTAIYMKFRIPGCRPVNQSTQVATDRRDAVRAASAVLETARANVRQGRPPFADRMENGVTLRAVMDLWLELPRNRTDRTKAQRCDCLCQFFGDDCSPMRVTTARVEHYVAQRLGAASRLGGTITANTVKRELAILNTVLAFGKGEHLYSEWGFNAPKLRILKRDKKRTAGKLHPPEKLAAFLAACPPDIAALFRFARMTGARRDELLRLQRVELRLTGDVEMPATITLKDTKSKVERTLKLNQEALRAVTVGLNMDHETLIWPLPFKSISSRIHKVNKQLGHVPGDYITLRDMRHLVATQMYNSGLPIEVVMAQLGHTCRVTTDTYIHIPQDAIEAKLHLYWSTHDKGPLVPGLKERSTTPAHHVAPSVAMRGTVATC